MASHVVVIDSAARRVTIKTTPGKYLSDVLEEACEKFGLNASQYGLKNNNKQIDLSRTYRLSGLSSGAKLELVQLSRSAAVVSVALQLPEPEAQGLPNGRLTDKFPSTTTLWLLLRKFEAGVAGGAGTKRNLTARGSSRMTDGSTSQGRVYYEMPVIQVMGRELSSFTDLQKTLGQLGFNSGSTLLRLRFRVSDTPLEEAMAQMEEYFKPTEDAIPAQAPASSAKSSSPIAAAQTQATGSMSDKPELSATSESTPAEQTTVTDSTEQPPSELTPPPPTVSPPEATPVLASDATQPQIQVYLPPSSTTPLASALPHNPADYTPTVEHAQTHQRLLSASSRNVRLPTEAELAASAAAEKEKLEKVGSVELKVRFPDESSIVARFEQAATGDELYQTVRTWLDEKIAQEQFALRIPGSKGMAVPDSGQKRLIRDLGLRGRVLVVFSWDDGASLEARGTRQVLKRELRARATAVRVEDVGASAGADEGDAGVKVNISKADPDAGGKEKEKKKGVPKWLGKLSKK